MSKVKCYKCAKELPIGGSACPYCGDNRVGTTIGILLMIVLFVANLLIATNFHGSFKWWFIGLVVSLITGFTIGEIINKKEDKAAMEESKSNTTMETKLESLRGLLDKGLISADEYQTMRADILQSV